MTFDPTRVDFGGNIRTLQQSAMRFVKFLAVFLLLAGDVSSKPASLEANIPAVGCDGRANILLATEVFLTDQALSGCSTVVAVFGLLSALLVRVCLWTISGRLKVVYKSLTLRCAHAVIAS